MKKSHEIVVKKQNYFVFRLVEIDKPSENVYFRLFIRLFLFIAKQQL